MKLASYHGTRSGINGIGNRLIRLRLHGRYSHSEILFEPGDGVDHLMPDGTTAPDADGAYWCASSVALERLPDWSPRRAGHRGGVRFKRIVPDPAKWELQETGRDPLFAARWAHENQGMPYDWQLIAGEVVWLFRDKAGRVMCSEACAQMLRLRDAWRFNPCVLPAAAAALPLKGCP